MKAFVHVAALAALAAAMPATASHAENAAAAPDQPVVMTPKVGLPLDIGGKRVVGYFEQENGECAVTVVLGEGYGESTNAPQGTRVAVPVAPGKSLHIDGAKNQTAEFFCGPAGRKMNARVYTRESYKGKNAAK